MTAVVGYHELPGLAGRDLGFTDYLEITQDRVNTFADATDDHQFIHVDPVRAASGPFGATVAHGYLTLSLAAHFRRGLLRVEGAGGEVGYGLERVRFISPVKVGERIRLRAVVAEVTETPEGYRLDVDETIEIEGGAKPAMVARTVFWYSA